MVKRLKILVSAYACEPNKGSEPEVGWQWVNQLARKHEVWVLTKANNKQQIDEYCVCEKTPNLHFVYLDLPIWARFWKKGNRGVHLYYGLWQILAFLKGWQLNRSKKFDIAHHLTFSPFYRAPLICMLPIPFIWGPIGAGEILPKQYWDLFTIGQKAREILRLIIRNISIWNPLIYFAMRKARIIVAATHETSMVIPYHLRNKVVVEAQIGMDLESPNEFKSRVKNNSELRILTAGRHVYWKGHIIIIRAFAKYLKKYGAKAVLVVLSDGPEHTRLQNEVKRLCICQNVKFMKWLPDRKDVFREYASADIFAYCSFFECGGYVVLEAMANGVPVVSIQLGGPGEIVTNECGILVPPGSIEQTVEGFVNAFKKMNDDNTLLKEKSRKTTARVEHRFQWNVKGDRLLKLLEEYYAQ